MNKAFVKETVPDPCCPPGHGCGGPGTEVPAATLQAQLDEAQAGRFSQTAYFCPNPVCPVVYFDNWGTWVGSDQLASVPYPKNPSAPVCGCFGMTEQEIRTDAASGNRQRIRELLERSRGPDADCVRRSPAGRACEAEVRRLFMKYFQPAAD